jgi:CO/xanthine dehydrogenase FAD-binding subunit
MLLNLKTIHRPETLDEAIMLLRDPGTFPLYGGGALQRNPRPNVQAAVQLERLQLDYVRDSENSLRLGSMLTLEQVRQACDERAEAHPRLGAVGEALKMDFPETLRHTLTLGDLLVERNPQSWTLTLLLALGGVLKRLDVDMHFTMAAWLSVPDDVSRYLIAHMRLSRGSQQTAVAFEKVARTPADAPIVGAVAAAEAGEGGYTHTTLAVCGVAPMPIPQPAAARALDMQEDMDTVLDALRLNPTGDHWGSAEYRTEMARVVCRRALTRARADAIARAQH